jgi:hypothetical protein
MQPEDAWWGYGNISKHNTADNKLNEMLININFFFYIQDFHEVYIDQGPGVA